MKFHTVARKAKDSNEFCPVRKERLVLALNRSPDYEIKSKVDKLLSG